jgi:hypothetical protein
MNGLLRAVAIGGVWLVAGAALAQGPGVASSGMGQGEAHITTRTGLSLALEPAASTTTARVQAMGRAVSARMSAVRACYDRVVAARPTVTGVLRMQLTLAEGSGPVTVEVTEDGVHDAEMTTCAREALLQIAVADVPRPASVYAVLTLANTAAEGAARAAQHASDGEEVALAHEGGAASATSEPGDVQYVVRGAAGVADEVVAEGYRVVRSQVAGLRDCRRHAARRGRSPGGQMTVTVTMTSGAPLVAHVEHSTVAIGRDASQCVEQRLGRAPRVPHQAGALTVELTFAP